VCRHGVQYAHGGAGVGMPTYLLGTEFSEVSM